MLNCAGITVDYDRSWMAASQVGGRVCVLDFRTGYVLQKLKICDGEIQQVRMALLSPHRWQLKNLNGSLISSSEIVSVIRQPHLPNPAVQRYRGLGENSVFDFHANDMALMSGKKLAIYNGICDPQVIIALAWIMFVFSCSHVSVKFQNSMFASKDYREPPPRSTFCR